MTTGAAHSAASGASTSVWRVVLIALAVYFLLSIVASVWARLRGTDRPVGAGRAAGKGRWARRLRTLPDAIVMFVASPPSPSGTGHGREATGTGPTRQRATGAAVAHRARHRARR
ncbi:hypothetical protein [Streptomyces coeruleorubidus]|uniref:hypothetical protein n=1 Tax=Streptomyces coeruleorubidus TaxID=116188 RepID=UPI0033B6CA66